MSLRENLEQKFKPTILPVESDIADGMGLYKRTFSGAEGDTFLEFCADRLDESGKPLPGSQRKMNAIIFALGICDEAGAALFDAANPEDVDAVHALQYPLIEALATEVSDLNRLSQRARDAAKKNSPNPTDDSGSDSPDTSDTPSES